MDCGSDISLIKFNPNFIINKNECLEFSGITEGTKTTLGTTKVDLLYQNHKIIHKFHVIEENFELPTFGLLGKDFLRGLCNIDMINDRLIISQNDINLTIPIFDSPDINTWCIPPKCEIVKKLNNFKHEEDMLVEPKELANGVLCGKSVINKNSPYVRILNTNNKHIYINQNLIKLSSVKNYNIMNLNTNNNNSNQNDSRKSTINEIIFSNKNHKNLPNEVKEKLKEVISEYSDIFHLEGEKLTCNNFYSQEINLNDNTPVFIKNYRQPHQLKQELKKQIQKLENESIIEKSESIYSSPCLLIPKKSQDNSKKWRLCIDYRQLNKKIVNHRFPITRSDDIFDNLGNSTWFSTMDFQSGYHQVEIKPEFRHFTSFMTEDGTYQWTRCPFGLNLSGSAFVRMMTLAFAGICPSKAFIYVDDIIIFGKNIADHLENIKAVFEVCRLRCLKLNPNKCLFFQNSVTFLGHLCTDKGITVDPEKTKAIEKYPTPTNATEVKSFVQFANFFRKFIPNFAEICICLNNLTKKNVPFQWNQNHEEAFLKIKECLLKMPILHYPDFNKEFIIQCDASDKAMGAVLLQNHDGEDKIIAFASKSFTKGEANKSTILKELTAIHWSINHFKPYIYGYKFKVMTDHKPLIFLYSCKDLSSKLMRMRLDLDEYDFTIEYIPGTKNIIADTMSRINIQDLKEMKTKNVFQVQTRSMTKAQDNINNEIIENESALKLKEYEQKVFKKSRIQIRNLPKISTYKINNNLTLKFKNANYCTLQICNCKNDAYSLTEECPQCNCTSNLLKDVMKNINAYTKSMYIDTSTNDTSGTKDATESTKDASENRAQINKNIREYKISTSDAIFSLVSITAFVKSGNEMLDETIKIFIFENPSLINDSLERQAIIKLYHDDKLLGGHTGLHRTIHKISELYTWPKLRQDVSTYIKNCKKCQLSKAKNSHKEPLIITSTPEEPFQTVQIDTYCAPESDSLGNKYAITIMCELTKYLVIIPTQDKSAKTTAKAIFENFILIYGNFTVVKSDLGTEFICKLFEELKLLLNFQHITSTAYHHESLGIVERNHRELNIYIRNFIKDIKNDQIGDWSEYAKTFAFFYNVQPNILHGYSPFQLIFAKNPKILPTSSQTTPIYNFDNYVQNLKHILNYSHNKAREFINKQKLKTKNQFDNKTNSQTFEIGDKVIIKNNIRNNKFEPLYKGHFIITRLLDNGNIELTDENNKIKILHKNEIFKI